jgi:hypothetical protein
MKRWTLTILLFLLLGAVVNVAVAWGLAWWLWDEMRLDHKLVHQPTLDDCAWWEEHVGPALDGGIWRAQTIKRHGIEVHHLYGAKRRPRRADATRVWTGWPAFSMIGSRWTVYDEGAAKAYYRARTRGIDSILRHAPPIRPIWPGFALNTLFYALILWLLIPGPFVLRRHIRVKRGRCPKCGYDLRGAIPGAGGGCPECGWGRPPAPGDRVRTQG